MSLQAYVLSQGEKRQRAAEKIAHRANLDLNKKSRPTANERKAVDPVNQLKRQHSKFKSLIRNSADRLALPTSPKTKTKTKERGFSKLKGWKVHNPYTMIPDVDDDDDDEHKAPSSVKCAAENRRKVEEQVREEVTALRECVRGEGFGAHVVRAGPDGILEERQVDELSTELRFARSRPNEGEEATIIGNTPRNDQQPSDSVSANLDLTKSFDISQLSKGSIAVNKSNLNPANTKQPTKPKLLPVTLRHEREICPWPKELLAESKIRLNVDRDISLAQLLSILKRHAAAAAFGDHIDSYRIVGFPRLVHQGKTRVLTEEWWGSLKSSFPTRGAGLEFSFEVIMTGGGDWGEGGVELVGQKMVEMAFV